MLAIRRDIRPTVACHTNRQLRLAGPSVHRRGLAVTTAVETLTKPSTAVPGKLGAKVCFFPIELSTEYIVL